MHLPLISIVVSTYNGEQFLEEQIESLLHQNYPNTEIIVSDDASTDKTREILSKYTLHPKMKIFFQDKNAGYSKNFFQTAFSSKGEFIAFCDQDDIWLPEKINILYKSIGSHYLVYSNSKLINETGHAIGIKLSDVRNMGKVNSSVGFFLSNVVWGHSTMIRRKLLDYFLPLPRQVEYDKWLAIQATLLTGITYVNEPLTLYRQHANTITKTISQKKATSRKKAARYYDYKKQLGWLEVLMNNKLEKEKIFYQKFYQVFLTKEKGVFSWPLFFFLLKHQRKIFVFIKKNFFSKLVEIRKMSRGEKI